MGLQKIPICDPGIIDRQKIPFGRLAENVYFQTTVYMGWQKIPICDPGSIDRQKIPEVALLIRYASAKFGRKYQ
jgi:hypothetical protein